MKVFHALSVAVAGTKITAEIPAAKLSFEHTLDRPVSGRGRPAVASWPDAAQCLAHLPGVAASVFYFNGSTSAPAAGAPLVENEWDFNLEWRPNWKPLQGLWLRARYGTSSVWQGGGRTNIDEVRLILNYNIKMY